MQRKKILITGSSRGIGAAIARRAKEENFDVVLHGQTNSDVLIALKDELDCEAIYFDVADWDDVKHKLSCIDRIDGLVNCAGVNYSAPFEELKLEHWRSIYSVNVFGLVGVSLACLPFLRQSPSARIVNVGSVKGQYSAVGRAAYATSKAAVSQLTVAMAKELAPDILVNCIAPGFVDTDMTQNTMSPRIKSQIQSALLGRIAHPDEIAASVLFFCGDKCSFITGQTLTVDGGFSIKKD